VSIVLFDVDGVLADGQEADKCQPRPGLRLLLDTLACLGYQLVAWSAGGRNHARAVVEACGFHGTIQRYLSKPDYPMAEEDALMMVGEVPALQIDDDPTERVGSWPFMVWPGWYGERGSESDEAAIRTGAEAARLREALEEMVASDNADTPAVEYAAWCYRLARRVLKESKSQNEGCAK